MKTERGENEKSEVAIIGPDNSTTAFAAREQVAEPNKIVIISFTGSSPKLTAGNPRWFFRGATPAIYQTTSLAAYLVKQIGIVYDEFIKIGGKAVEGVIASIGFTVANEAKNVQAFVAAFRRKYPGGQVMRLKEEQ